MINLDRAGDRFVVEAQDDATLLILTGEPIDEPVVSYGPFVMNTESEIHQAIKDYQSGRMGRLIVLAPQSLVPPGQAAVGTKVAQSY